MSLKAVKDMPGWFRTGSGAVINTNGSEMNQARKRKNIWRQQQEELKTLKSDVSEMKIMLHKLLEDKNGNN